MIGVGKTTITGYESGHRKPDVATIKKLANALGVSADTLLDIDTSTTANENSPFLSEEAAQLAKDYQLLDRHGKAVIRSLMDEELLRMEEMANLDIFNPLEEPKVINLFDNPSAAGLAIDETGQGCIPYELTPSDPQGAEFAVRIQGNSMEPDFKDGGIAFVNHDQMRDGDIGIFCVDGANVIKQWHYDKVLGITYLFSLNRDRADADLVITRNSGRNLVWQGRVITKKHYPLPGM